MDLLLPRAAVSAGSGVPPVFLRLLLAGALEPIEYAGLLVQYREVYAALDRAAAAHVGDDPLLGRLRAGIRAGLEDLEADLCVLLGPGWAAEDAEIMPATRAYSACASAAAASVEGLVGHHMVRYIGDRLGAGQIHLTLGEAYGPLAARLAFHAVPDPADEVGVAQAGSPVLAADAWTGFGAPRAWTRERRERVAAEAAVAGACDRALFDELGAALARR